MGREVSLDRYAQVRADMEAGVLRDEALARAGVTAEEWAAAQRGWLERMGAELALGRFDLADRYASAFGERQRAQSGPGALVTPVAGETPTVEATLHAGTALPQATRPPLRRAPDAFPTMPLGNVMPQEPALPFAPALSAPAASPVATRPLAAFTSQESALPFQASRRDAPGRGPEKDAEVRTKEHPIGFLPQPAGAALPFQPAPLAPMHGTRAPAALPGTSDDDAESVLARLLEHVPTSMERAATPAPATANPGAAPALRMARVASVHGHEAQIVYRGRAETVKATLDAGVDRALVARALAGDEAVLVEVDPESGPVIVGTVQTRLPDAVELKARRIVVEAEEELLLRSGHGAMRMRADGNVEIVGSRISALSRGLYRIVGRILRLN